MRFCSELSAVPSTHHPARKIALLLAAGLVPFRLVGCYSSGGGGAGSGGATSSGGSSGSGSGGTTASGGEGAGGVGSGGTTSSGGTTGSGGTTSTGGVTVTGGATSTGGRTTTGGSSGSGGVSATGGTTAGSSTIGSGGRAASGGATGTGGRGTGGAGSGGTGAGGAATGGTSGGGDGGASGQCPAAIALKVGDNSQSLSFGGLDRTYTVRLPPGYTGSTPAPVVFDFHGMGTTGKQEESFDTWNTFADKQGIIAVYPDGTDKSWNAGSCCPSASTNKIDDVGFVKAIIARLQTDVCIDTKRIYATGCSNGGAMSFRMACEAADVIAAVAPVDFDTALNPCKPSRPITEIQFRATNDSMVAYSGAEPNFTKWGGINQCTGTLAAMTSNSACEAYPECASGVETILCTIQGGSHCGNYSTFKIPEVAWGVLQKHTLP
jgi:polyhydroxybutyrate depolymerase